MQKLQTCHKLRARPIFLHQSRRITSVRDACLGQHCPCAMRRSRPGSAACCQAEKQDSSSTSSQQLEKDENEDDLDWELGPGAVIGFQQSDPGLVNDDEQADSDANGLEEEGRSYSSSYTNWDASVSEQERARLDLEAREFAYSFGTAEVRDLAHVEDGGVEDSDPSNQEESDKGQTTKGRRRNERRSGRPKDSSIPLHMLPKVINLNLILLPTSSPSST